MIPEPAMTITDAASDGTRRDLLSAVRDRIAETVQNPKTLARDLPPLTRRLLEVSAEIEAIDAYARDEADYGPVPDAPFDPASI